MGRYASYRQQAMRVRPGKSYLVSDFFEVLSAVCLTLWFLAATRWAASAIHSCHEEILLGLGPKQQSQPTLYWILWRQTPRWTLSSFGILSGMLSHSETCHTATHNFPHDLFTVPFLSCFSPGCVHNASILMLMQIENLSGGSWQEELT